MVESDFHLWDDTYREMIRENNPYAVHYHRALAATCIALAFAMLFLVIGSMGLYWTSIVVTLGMMAVMVYNGGKKNSWLWAHRKRSRDYLEQRKVDRATRFGKILRGEIVESS